MNFFVGGLQVITPTFIIFTANGNADIILAALGLYLFGWTYLYVGINLAAGLDGTGLGYFSLFVAVCALVFSYLDFNRFHDNSFGVIWLYWAFFWILFFVLLGLKVESLGRYTRAVAAIEGWVIRAISAFLLLTGNWESTTMQRPSHWQYSRWSSSLRCIPCWACAGPPRPQHHLRSLTGPPRPPPGDQPADTIAVQPTLSQ